MLLEPALQDQTVGGATARLLSDIGEIGAAQGVRELGEIWTRHTKGHPALLARYGFENFKRTINFNYGQSAVGTFHHPLIRALFAALVRSGRLPTGALARVNWNDAANIRWHVVVTQGRRFRRIGANTRRLLAYAICVGLLWQLAETADAVGCLDLDEPAFGHPMPVTLHGRLISQDQALTSFELNRMAEFIPLAKVRRVLEIGAGYGRLAYFFHKVFPQAQYVVADIAPALAVSQNYLAATLGESNVERFNPSPTFSAPFSFILPAQLKDVPDGFFDLVINVNSMDEMPPQIVGEYLKTIARVCRGHVYLSGWPAKRDESNGERIGVNEFPYDPAWRPLYSGPHRAPIGFVERMIAVGE